MIACWSCGQETAQSADTACDTCAEAYLAHEQYMQEGYEQAREERVAQAQQAYDNWRQASYEKRLQEQADAEQRRQAYRDEVLEREWASFNVAHKDENPLLRMCAAQDFQNVLESRYEWLR